MEESFSDVKPKTTSKATGFWSNNCFRIYLALPIVGRIVAAWLGFKEFYDSVCVFVSDAFVVVLLLWICWIERNEKLVQARTYLSLGVLLGVTCLATWNFVALYTSAGTEPLTILGWEFTKHPCFYGVSLFIVLILIAAGLALLKRGKHSKE